MFQILKQLWAKLNKPSSYDIWNEAFKRLQDEKKKNRMSQEYWRIWHEEVCPAYRRLTESTLPPLRHPLTRNILEDMDKPISEREHF